MTERQKKSVQSLGFFCQKPVQDKTTYRKEENVKLQIKIKMKRVNYLRFFHKNVTLFCITRGISISLLMSQKQKSILVEYTIIARRGSNRSSNSRHVWSRSLKKKRSKEEGGGQG